MTYHDLRSIEEFQDKTILAVKAPQDTVLTFDTQEVGVFVSVWGGGGWFLVVHELGNTPEWCMYRIVLVLLSNVMCCVCG